MTAGVIAQSGRVFASFPHFKYSSSSLWISGNSGLLTTFSAILMGAGDLIFAAGVLKSGFALPPIERFVYIN